VQGAFLANERIAGDGTENSVLMKPVLTGGGAFPTSYGGEEEGVVSARRETASQLVASKNRVKKERVHFLREGKRRGTGRRSVRWSPS